MTDLELAQQLIDHGIPVVICTPRRGWKPGDGRGDVLPPAGWNTIAAAECDLSKFRPGKDILAMVSGHGLDVVDLDAKAGASPEDLPAFDYFGVNRTPSGGWHYFVPSTGFAKASPLIVSGKAVGDYAGGTKQGSSRLLVYLPGSSRPKYAGKHYTVETQLDVAKALDSEPDERLVEMLELAGVSREGSSAEKAVDDPSAKKFLARYRNPSAMSCRYGRRAVADMLAEGDLAASGGRHGWITKVTARIVELMRAGCATSDDFDELERKLHKIKPEGGTDVGRVLAWAIANAAEPVTNCSIHSLTDASDALDAYSGGKDVSELLDIVRAFGSRFIAWPSPEAADAWAAWVIHTHLTDYFDSTPRLAIVAPEKGSGKTRVLEITETLVPNPLRAASTSTPVLFRLIGSDFPPTVLIDEADAIWAVKGGNEDLRAMLNAGHRRGSDVMRMVGEGAAMKAQKFATFAPVALAGIGDLPDTLMDRSVVIRMKRRASHEVVEPFRFRTGQAEGRSIFAAIADWAENVNELPMPEELGEITDRLADVWEPLIAIADLAGDGWPERIRRACLVLSQQDADDVSLRVRLLGDLRQVWPTGFTFTSTSELIRLLTNLDDAPWAPEGPFGVDGITSRKLAGMLRPYGIKPAHDSTKTQRGYRVADLADAWSRYLNTLPPEQASEPSEPSGLEVVA